MITQDYATYHEIKSQATAWAQAIEIMQSVQLPKAEQYDQVIFTGCGSTYYLSLAAAALYQQLTSRVARAIPSSELWLNSQTVLTDQKILLVAVSRSGTTTETLKAVDQFKTDQRGFVLAISNYHEALTQRVDLPIVIPQGQESSVAQTRSFASMYLAALVFSLRMAGCDHLLQVIGTLPETGNRLIETYETFAREMGENLDQDRFYFLGSGPRYGLACEANLKMKEMTLTHSEPFHFLEFRHGPMSMVNPQTVIIGLVSEANYRYETTVLREMRQLGAKTVSLGESDTDIAFESAIPECARGVLYLPVLQLMAFYRALAKGLNPDRPNNLQAVVKLNP